MPIDLTCSVTAVDGKGKPIQNNGYTHDGATVAFSVKNNSVGDDALFKVERAVFREGVALVGPVVEQVLVQAGQTHVFPNAVLVPDGPGVQFKATLKADVADTVNEDNETNNVAELRFKGNMPT